MPGTIWPREWIEDEDATASAEEVKNAFDGLGTNEQAIIDVLKKHSIDQRLEIAKAYKVSYGQDMVEDLKGELGGNFEQVVVAMICKPRLFDARELHSAMTGGGTDESTLVEILASRTKDEIEEIKEAYKEEYEVELEDDLQGDTGGNFGRLLVSLCTAGREEEDDDDDRAEEDADKLFQAGAGAWGTDENELNAVLCRRSFSQLVTTFEKYNDKAGNDIEDAIENETSGTLQEGFLALVRVARNKPKFFARRLHRAMTGLGTNDEDLIRLVVSRSEVDLEDIKEEFNTMYEKSLSEWISDECGGDYKRMLLALI